MRDEAKKQLVLDYQETFGKDAGKRVYWHLSEVNYYNSSFVNVMQGTSEQIAFELGKREAFIQIMKMMKADPEQEIQETAEYE